MKRTVWLLSALLMAAPMAFTADDPKGPPRSEKAGSPQEQFDSLKHEYETGTKEMQSAQEMYRQRMQSVQSLGKRLMDYAEKHSKDPGSVDALILLGSNTVDPQSRQKALELLAANHLESAKIGGVCTALLSIPNGEKHVRSIVEKNPHHQAQGQARLALAGVLKLRLKRPSPSDDKDALAREAEILLEEIIAKYADVQSDGASLADSAKRQLTALKALTNLEPGKTIPEIVGPDLDGKEFKLSDYRGKVVMLDFWGHW
jgi:hypothetical protein